MPPDLRLLDQPERRFPLDLGSPLPRVRDLFKAATRNQWDPIVDIPWAELRPERYSDAEREAGRFFWSRRAWGEYGAVSESPALSIRFCQEKREPDLQYFFTLRTQEEARHAEASWMMAERLGGYIAEPVKRELQQSVATHGVRAMALDPATPLEGIIAGLVCVLEEYGFDWFKLMAETATNPAVIEMLRLIARDEARHCAFGWLYIGPPLRLRLALYRGACAEDDGGTARRGAPGHHQCRRTGRDDRLPGAVAGARQRRGPGGKRQR
jgi:hypothetical protein